MVARRSETCAYATLDPALQQELGLDREGFEDATCLLRGAVTHDGLPFQLPVAMQPLVFGVAILFSRMSYAAEVTPQPTKGALHISRNLLA
jgi:hypothetical protein